VQRTRLLGAIILVKFEFFSVLGAVNPHPWTDQGQIWQGGADLWFAPPCQIWPWSVKCVAPDRRKTPKSACDKRNTGRAALRADPARKKWKTLHFVLSRRRASLDFHQILHGDRGGPCHHFRGAHRTHIKLVNFVKIVQGTRPLGAIILVKFGKVLGAVNPHPWTDQGEIWQGGVCSSMPNFILIDAACRPCRVKNPKIGLWVKAILAELPFGQNLPVITND